MMTMLLPLFALLTRQTVTHQQMLAAVIDGADHIIEVTANKIVHFEHIGILNL